MTRWADEVSPERVHPEYPRPQFQRERWQSLNGLWDIAVVAKSADKPEQFSEQILVPFPVESALSGLMRPVKPDQAVWYRRTWEPPADAPPGTRWRLHFGAVDWRAEVHVNGRTVGQHDGGYDRWWCDITEALRPSGPQEILVRVWDPTDEGFQPRGKQVRSPEGIWYTSVTGIWQSVWIEPVPATRIESLRITPKADLQSVELQIEVQVPAGPAVLRATALDTGRVVQSTESKMDADDSVQRIETTLTIPEAKLWSPDNPFLYDLRLELVAHDQPADKVTSYFGMRKIEIRPDDHGVNRLFLNNQPLFQLGPLDQGWWPDGLYTAPTDEALRYDIEMTKRLGFNMCRKHVKVEPDRWYYWCDRLGLMVWQDMPNGDAHIRDRDADLVRSPESAANYRREWQAIMDACYNHPSIVVWVPFNEGWGQFQTDEILAWTKKYDPSRLVDGPSGWTDRGSGDIHDMHRYPGPGMPPLEPRRAAVLGEFGGLGMPREGHLWWNKRNWGYRTFHSADDLQSNYELLYAKLRPLVQRGLAAAIYTQTTDVEGEVNGLMTYDRKVVKFNESRLSELHRAFYRPMKSVRTKTIVPTSENEPQTWRYTTMPPPSDWTASSFSDQAWQEGQGGFGEPSTPGSAVRTTWTRSDIWLRRGFELSGPLPQQLYLRVHHDEDAEIYLNGQRIATLQGYETGYVEFPLATEAAQHLRRGQNVLAVHCRQTGGGQYIDVGLVEAQELSD
jgi:hypothetical protein